jgi:hypothetical protein
LPLNTSTSTTTFHKPTFHNTRLHHVEFPFLFTSQLNIANMFKSTILRQASRASTTAIRQPTTSFLTRTATRGLRTTPALREKSDESNELSGKIEEYTTAGKPGASEHEGQFSRTDKTIRVEHPEEADLPSSAPVQGRGGFHFRRTLATFSLEGRVGVVTGGARGLGLVMSQALVISGADVAIVDLNSK